MSGGTRGKPWSPGCIGNVFFFFLFFFLRVNLRKCVFLSSFQISLLMQSLSGAERSSVVETGRGLKLHPLSSSSASPSDF